DRAQHLVQGVERRAGQALSLAAALDLQAVGVQAVDLARRGAEEAETGDPLAAADALEQEAVRRDLGKTAVDGQRRQAVGQELPNVRHRVTRPARNPLRWHRIASKTKSHGTRYAL